MTLFWYYGLQNPELALGQPRHFDRGLITSGPSPETDILGAGRHVVNVPTTEVADTFDYLVGLPERRRRAGKQFYASL